MNRIIAFSFLAILVLAVFVSAYTTEYVAPVYEGWNLVYGFMSPDQLQGQGFEASHIKAIYGFLPITQEYVRVYPNPEVKKLQTMDDQYMANTAFWVYSDATVEGELNGISHGTEYWLKEDPLSYDKRQLVQGWNFVGFTSDMFDGNPFAGGLFSWNTIKGSCNFEKIHTWNPETKDWITISSETQSNDFNDFIGSGMIVKVSDDCKLGEPETSVSNPPQIPNSSKTNECSSYNYQYQECISNNCICEGPDCRVCWPKTSETVCTDSDGGLNYGVKGTVKCGDRTYTDHCTDPYPSTVVEYVKSEEFTGVGTPHYICPYGCKDGACIGKVTAEDCIKTTDSIICGSITYKDYCAGGQLTKYYIENSEIKAGIFGYC